LSSRDYLAFAQLWHVFNMRGARSGLLRNMVTRNPRVWLALAFCTAILLTTLYWPPLAEPLHLIATDQSGWGVILALSLAPLVLIQLGMMVAAALRPRRANREARA
jgi:Ca2+-transporting ATPase